MILMNEQNMGVRTLSCGKKVPVPGKKYKLYKGGADAFLDLN